MHAPDNPRPKDTELALPALQPVPASGADETIAEGMLAISDAPDQSLAAPAIPLSAIQRESYALAWARSNGWITDGHLEALRRQWGNFEAIPDVPRVLHDSGLIDGDQRKELVEVLGLSREVPSVRLRKRLGSGAVGGVYLARSVDEDQQVAIKVLHREIADQAEPRARFEREVSTLSRLDHRGIPKLLGHDCDAKVPYCIMEFVPGVTLGELLKEAGALPESYVLWAAVQIAQTLEYAYRRGGGLVHRDIKPDNLIVQLPEGTQAESLFTSRHPIKIIDFGLARPQEEVSSLTMTGMVVGTPRYMAPEQVKGEELDWRADLYSLGATCYHLLTGRSPFDGTSTADVMVAHLQSPVPDPGATVPALTRRTCGLVMRCMAKDRSARFSDYRSFIHACEQALAAIDSRPVVLLRKPFVMPEQTSRIGRAIDPGSGDDQTQSAGLLEDTPQAASRTGAVRSRIHGQHRRQRGTDRVALRNGSGGAIGGDVPAPAARAPRVAEPDPLRGHDEVFGEVDGVGTGRTVRPGRGATEALRRVLEARARGEATEFDLVDLDEHTDRLRRKTEAIIDRGMEVRPTPVLPTMLLAAAAVLCLAVAALRFL